VEHAPGHACAQVVRAGSTHISRNRLIRLALSRFHRGGRWFESTPAHANSLSITRTEVAETLANLGDGLLPGSPET
jgi:hypothetical protein